MSGIFRYNGSNTISPKRRSTLSPFCSSSPSHIQDATMDNSSAFGYRSPSSFLNNGSGGHHNGSGGLAGAASAGNTSPGHRLSLRDYDEQLNSLRRENFNLKLRIYFLESNTPGNMQADGKEAVYKQNVDLKVETEALRAELKEKQSLICEAATALNLIEQTQKSNAAEHAARCKELHEQKSRTEQKNHELELELQAFRVVSNSSETLARSTGNNESQIDALEANVRQMEIAAARHAEQMADAENRIAAQEEQVRLAEQQYTELCVEMEQLKKNASAPVVVVRSPGRHGLARLEGGDAKLQQSIIDEATLQLRQQLADRDCEIISLQESLAAKQAAHDTGCNALMKMTIRAKTLEKELKKHQSFISTSAHENLTSTSTIPSPLFNDADSSQKAKLQEQLAAARKEAAQANAWRQECSDVCTALTIRLKELAEFLDTLLHNQDVLGAIEQERRKAMRRAVDSSITLSNSLHDMSLSGERFSLSMNYKNISSLFVEQHQLLQSLHLPNNSIVGAQGTANKSLAAAVNGSQNEEDDKENVLPEVSTNMPKAQQHQQQLMLIENLRTEVRTLEAELQERKAHAVAVKHEADDLINNTTSSNHHTSNSNKRDQSRHNKTPSKSERHSESDACWSEPDRQVSQARIGLEDSTSLRNHSATGSNSGNSFRTSPRKQAGCATDGDSSLSSLDCGCGSGGKSTMRVCESTSQLAALNGKYTEQVSLIWKQQQDIISGIELQKQELRIGLDAAAEENRLMSQRNDATIAALRNEIELLENARSVCESHLSECRAQCERLKADAATTSEHHVELINAMREAHDDELATTVLSVQEQLQEYLSLVEFLRKNECELQAQIVEDEQRMRELRSALDEMQLQKRAANSAIDKMRCEKYTVLERVGELQKRVAELEKLNAAMQNRMVSIDAVGVGLIEDENLCQQRQQQQSAGASRRHMLSRSASSGTNFMYGIGGCSAVTSEGCGGASSSEERKQRLENSSPDLGIESDAGRTSGSETAAANKQQQQQQRRANMSAPVAMTAGLVGTQELRFVEDEEESQIVNDASESVNPTVPPKHDCALVDRDIVELKRKLTSMHQVHRQVLQQLRTSNTRKEQVERDIRREICKTHTVLQTARSNIESAAGQQSSRHSQSPTAASSCGTKR